MPSPAAILSVNGLPLRKLSALKRKARQMGLTPESYVRQLIEDDLELDAKAQNTSLETLAAPFREAMKGMSDEQIDRLVDSARAPKPTPTRRAR